MIRHTLLIGLVVLMTGCSAANAPTSTAESRPCIRGHDVFGVSLFNPVFVCDEYAPAESTVAPRGGCLPEKNNTPSPSR